MVVDYICARALKPESRVRACVARALVNNHEELSKMALATAMVLVGIVLLLETPTTATKPRSKRMIPNQENCNPLATAGDKDGKLCDIGDFVDKNIADCYYDETIGTCSASGISGSVISWVVAPDKHNRCKPNEKGKKFKCGNPGTNTRCVCSDHKIEINDCRCQYWEEDYSEAHKSAFCTAYYLGGDSKVHHYACCNNCNDSKPYSACDKHTYEGGSSSNYCESCGKATGGGLVKFVFNCGSCDVQSKCDNKCNNIFGLKLPGFCWKWVDCFKGCCEVNLKAKNDAKYEQFIATESDQAFSFCGDGECSDFESISSCPSDCCHKVNSSCSNDPQHCTHDCCQSESCCLT